MIARDGVRYPPCSDSRIRLVRIVEDLHSFPLAQRLHNPNGANGEVPSQ
jgi:hypothetical protein